MSRPRIRTLKPELWQDEAIGEVGRDARLLFVGLITQADDKGRLRGDPRLISSQLFPYDAQPPEQVEAWLAELDRVGLIQRYAHAGRPLICLPAWERHQKINRASEKVLPGPADEGSVRFHGSITDSSPPEGKGRDRKGKESEANASDVVPRASSLPVLAAKEEPQRSELPTAGWLSELLADLVAANDPDGKRPTVTARWLDAERLLTSRDGRSAKQVEEVIRWVAVDEFERTVVLSMPKLRQRYPQLVQKAQRANGRASGVGPATRRAEALLSKASALSVEAREVA